MIQEITVEKYLTARVKGDKVVELYLTDYPMRPAADLEAMKIRSKETVSIPDVEENLRVIKRRQATYHSKQLSVKDNNYGRKENPEDVHS